MSKMILKKIRHELKQNTDKKYKHGAENYFKEPVNFIGVRTPTVRKIATKYWEQIKYESKPEIFKLCEALLKNNHHNPFDEEATIAYAWAYRLKKQYQKTDFATFERWLKKYVSNWGKCDDFCTHAFGTLLRMYPELIIKTKPWQKSKNRWLRRASAVIFIVSANTYEIDPKYLKHVFATANALLHDKDDLVQKGYGWMLKAASHHNPKEVFEFVMERKDKMPRTALRYAIEKYPQEMRLRAMNK
jgi:3-methyladenine DNA glycosylase AlkD